MQTLGTRGRPNLAQVAADYRQLKAGADPEAVEAARLGREAAIAVKRLSAPTNRSWGSFGPTTRQMQAARARQSQLAFYTANKEKTMVEQAQLLMEKVYSGSSLASSLGLAKACSRLAKAAERQQEMEHHRVLQEYQNSQGETLVKGVLQQVPTLARSSLEVVPDPALRLFQLRPQSLVTQGIKACSVLSGNASSNAAKELQRYWQGLHTTVDSGMETGAERGASSRERPRPCLESGVCLCEGEGKVLKRCMQLFLKLMKERFRTQAQKLELAAGKVVCLCQPLHEGDEARGSNDFAEMEVFLHIGLMYWKPYRPTCQLMLRATKPEGEPPVEGALYLKVRDHCLAWGQREM